MQDEAINISDNFWSISTLQDNKKLYITCLQFSYLIKLHFPYDIIYLSDGCEANALTFVLPSNNKLNVEPIIETSEYKLGFNRLYSKINNFGLMLNVLSLTDNGLEALASKILEMKHVSISSIYSMLTELRSFPPNFWSPQKFIMFLP